VIGTAYSTANIVAYALGAVLAFGSIGAASGRSTRLHLRDRLPSMKSDVVCDLASKECVPCRGGVPPLSAEERAPLLGQLLGWQVVDGHHLQKSYTFKDFALALAFVNRVGALAEQNGHHPDLSLSWGKVGIEIYTHKIDGLTESDFVLAAKCDTVL
jgi:4a-hydroxytetrahydrobiopterin dehydratase